MQPNENRSDRGTSSEPIEPADPTADLEGPDFAVWADSDVLAPPDLPLPSSWEPELPADFPAIADRPVAPAAVLAESPAELPSPLATVGELAPAAVDAPLPDDGRRARLREWAAQLWTEAPHGRAQAGMLHLICTLDEAEFALPLAGVLEVQRLPAVTPAPHLPDWLLGLTNRRGEILSVVDLAAFLGLPSAAPAPTRRLVVVHSAQEEMTTGLVVDGVRGLRGLPADDLAEPALAVPFILGVAGTAAVLDLEGLLRSPRMRRPDLD